MQRTEICLSEVGGRIGRGKPGLGVLKGQSFHPGRGEIRTTIHKITSFRGDYTTAEGGGTRTKRREQTVDSVATIDGRAVYARQAEDTRDGSPAEAIALAILRKYGGAEGLRAEVMRRREEGNANREAHAHGGDHQAGAAI